MGTPKTTRGTHEFSKGVPEADYFEVPESIDVFSWSPEPAGTRNVTPTQVHLHFGAPPGPIFVIRFKGTGTLDAVIDALVEHRENVFGKKVR